MSNRKSSAVAFVNIIQPAQRHPCHCLTAKRCVVLFQDLISRPSCGSRLVRGTMKASQTRSVQSISLFSLTLEKVTHMYKCQVCYVC